MSQILHIFRKDVRHHWIEILVSFALVALYAWHEPKIWTPHYGIFLSDFMDLLPGLVPISWSFLILRAIQDEKLVGDRQFWVTRPYEWPNLLAAKILFVIAFVNLPFFIADALLVHAARVSPVAHLGGLLGLQFIMTLLIFLPVATAATVTPNLGHFLLLALGVGLYLIAYSAVASGVPNSRMNLPGFVPSGLIMVLAFGTCLVVAVWQYARRKTLQSRIALGAMLAAVMIVFAVAPYRSLIAQTYPLPNSGQAGLAQFNFDSTAVRSPNYEDVSPQLRGVDIQLPLRVAKISGLTVVKGIFVEVEGADGYRANSEWQSEFTPLRTDEDKWIADFGLKREIFERIRSAPANLHVSIALTTYQLRDQQKVVLSDSEFSVPQVGECSFPMPNSGMLQCRAIFRRPPLLATTSMETHNCRQTDNQMPNEKVASERDGNWDDTSALPDLALDPVVMFNLAFFVPGPDGIGHNWEICPGSEITFATPRPYQSSRAELDVRNIRIADYLVTKPLRAR